MQKLRENMPFAVVAIIFMATLSLVTLASVRANDGRLVYTLDDPYIHMAIAKNVATHGVFGVTRLEFSSCTSSPLWTVLLAVSYTLFGVSDWLPGVWATLFALAALYATDALARRLGAGLWGRLFAGLSVVYFAPLVPIISTGMEHTMHVFFGITLVGASVSFTLDPKSKRLAPVCIAGFLAVAARYESLFLVAPLALLLVFMKQWRGAVRLFVTAMLPVIVYGVFSLSHGAYFLPNSLMMKGNFPDISGFRSLIMALGGRGFVRLTADSNRHLMMIGILLLLGAARSLRRVPLSFLHLSLVGAIWLHLQFAATGWFYRYEAYLVAISLPFIVVLHFEALSQLGALLLTRQKVLHRIALWGCALLFLCPLLRRARVSMGEVVPASNHIYRQQFHMADFVRTMYPSGVRIALNDLGAVTYYADVDVLDLWGLGTVEVTRAKRSGNYNSAVIEEFLTDHETDVVIVYPHWFQGTQSLPKSAVWVANWVMRDHYHGKTVSFYSMSQKGARDLEERLRRYEDRLPTSVEVDYEITEQGTEGDAVKRAP